MQTAHDAPNHVGVDTPFDAPPHIQLPPQVEKAQQALMDLNDRALVFVRERPLTCLAGAVALGFIVGKLAARA